MPGSGVKVGQRVDSQQVWQAGGVWPDPVLGNGKTDSDLVLLESLSVLLDHILTHWSHSGKSADQPVNDGAQRSASAAARSAGSCMLLLDGRMPQRLVYGPRQRVEPREELVAGLGRFRGR